MWYIYATKSLADFVRQLAREIIGKFDSPLQQMGSNISQLLRGLKLTMEFDPITNQKYHLKAVGSVQRAIQYLSENEYIYPTEKGYIVYDRFLAFWL